MAYDKPLPNPTALSAPFWEGTKRRELLVQKCTACGALRWTPQWACRDCYSTEYDWAPMSGRGVVYTHTTIYRPQSPGFMDDVPYSVAVVELDEGPRMLTGITGCEAKDVHVGMPVEVAFEDASDKITLYKFKPAGNAARRVDISSVMWRYNRYGVRTPDGDTAGTVPRTGSKRR